jgi:hypothetical protein
MDGEQREDLLLQLGIISASLSDELLPLHFGGAGFRLIEDFDESVCAGHFSL